MPSRREVVACMLSLARLDERDTVYDLGSGDGRIVVGAARGYGARGVGIDIDPERVAEGRMWAERARVADRVEFVQGDLFTVDISGATVVMLYLFPDAILRLRPKLLSELRPGARILSNDFHMRGWTPDEVVELEHAFVYRWVVPARAAGSWLARLGAPGHGEQAELTLHQTYQVVRGEVELGGQRFRIRGGRLHGEELTFTLTGAKDRGPLRFTGRVRGDRLDGRLAPAARPSEGRDVAAERQAPEAPRSRRAPPDVTRG